MIQKPVIDACQSAVINKLPTKTCLKIPHPVRHIRFAYAHKIKTFDIVIDGIIEGSPGGQYAGILLFVFFVQPTHIPFINAFFFEDRGQYTSDDPAIIFNQADDTNGGTGDEGRGTLRQAQDRPWSGRCKLIEVFEERPVGQWFSNTSINLHLPLQSLS